MADHLGTDAETDGRRWSSRRLSWADSGSTRSTASNEESKTSLNGIPRRSKARRGRLRDTEEELEAARRLNRTLIRERNSSAPEPTA
jgi:hypothetical protein